MTKKFENNEQILTNIYGKIPTEKACCEWLFHYRWPDDFRCPRCGHNKYCPVPGRKQYECTKCGKQTSLTGGTLMHKSRIPLQKWFQAIRIFDENTDITATELSKMAELTKPTAGRLLKLMKSDTQKWHTLFKGLRIWLGESRGSL
ncbi:MAG: transposase [Treponema sp.]|nr:transposase [Treponema sp.]